MSAARRRSSAGSARAAAAGTRRPRGGRPRRAVGCGRDLPLRRGSPSSRSPSGRGSSFDSPMIRLLFAARRDLRRRAPAARDPRRAPTAAPAATARGGLRRARHRSAALWSSPGCRRACCCPRTGASSPATSATGCAGSRTPPFPTPARTSGLGIDLTLGGAGDRRRSPPRSPSGPRNAATRRRVAGAGLLLAAYAIPITLDDAGRRAVLGSALLLLSAAWLWISAPAWRPPQSRACGRARRRACSRCRRGAAGDEPLLDYRNWDWFGASASVSFDWDHALRPARLAARRGDDVHRRHRPRRCIGRRACSIASTALPGSEPSAAIRLAAAERTARRAHPHGPASTSCHPGWVPGRALSDRGAADEPGDRCRQARSRSTALGFHWRAPTARWSIPAGRSTGSTEYSIVTYDPDPTVEQLQEAPVAYPRSRFGEADPARRAADRWRPLRRRSRCRSGATRDPLIDRRRARARPTPTSTGSRAPGRRRLRRRTRRSPHIESQLRRNYAYTPDVPQHTYPLAVVPVRRQGRLLPAVRRLDGPDAADGRDPVAGRLGLRTGQREQRTTARYDVHDFDAHSWVEVYFRGIGWVTFDPTPAAAPAQSQHLEAAARATRTGVFPDADAKPASGGSHGSAARRGSADRGGGGSRPPAVPAAGWSCSPIAASPRSPGRGIVGLRGTDRRRTVDGRSLGRADRRAAQRRSTALGWHMVPGTTLLELERRVAGGAAGEPVARYAAMLRDHRYAPAHRPPCPSAEQRRAMRRSLSPAGRCDAGARGSWCRRAARGRSVERRRRSIRAACSRRSLYHDAAETEAIERFYGESLGLDAVSRWPGGVAYRVGPGCPACCSSARASPSATRRSPLTGPSARATPASSSPAPGRTSAGASASPRPGSRSPTSTSGATATARSTSTTRPATCSRSPTATSGRRVTD